MSSSADLMSGPPVFGPSQRNAYAGQSAVVPHMSKHSRQADHPLAKVCQSAIEAMQPLCVCLYVSQVLTSAILHPQLRPNVNASGIHTPNAP